MNEKLPNMTQLNLEEYDIVTTIFNDPRINEGTYDIVF